MQTPYGLAFDGFGNLYLSGYSGDLIRKINTSGIINTVAGDGPNYANGVPALTAVLGGVYGITFDASHNLFCSERIYDAIHKINTGTISVKQIENPVVNILSPNPNNGEFNVTGRIGLRNDEPVSITVLDILGHVVYQKETISQNGSINIPVTLTDAKSGLYILNIRTETENCNYHFAIQK